MYRLLIADDEALEREGLEWIVSRLMPGMFEVSHAENGRKAIERAAEQRPDIVLMDVKMPGISGLEALKEIRGFLPSVKMVLVTAYDYFEYAREALSLGVREYIVKPAKREQVLETLQRLVQELESEKQRRRDELALRDKYSQLLPLAESELAMLLMLAPRETEDLRSLADLLDFPVESGYALVLDFAAGGGQPAAPDGAGGEQRRRLYDDIRSFLKLRMSCVVSPLLEGRAAVFAAPGPGAGHAYAAREEALAWSAKLLELADRRAEETRLRIGVGGLHRGPEGLRRSCAEALLALARGDAAERAVTFASLGLAGEEAEAALAGVALLPGGGDASSRLGAAFEALQASRERETLSAMERAKRYIAEHYCDDLSLEEAAAHVHLNPQYFSKLFKYEAGETFIDYVTRLRIGKAQEMIREGGLSLKEVCYRVGYKDPNYFSRVFRKVTGLSPTEYRHSLRE